MNLQHIKWMKIESFDGVSLDFNQNVAKKKILQQIEKRQESKNGKKKKQHQQISFKICRILHSIFKKLRVTVNGFDYVQECDRLSFTSGP